MYKIHFDVKAGVWRIQIQAYGLFWRNICDAGKVRGWPNVKACEEFIENTGLDDIYSNYRRSPMAGIWQGYPQNANLTWDEPAVVRRRTA